MKRNAFLILAIGSLVCLSCANKEEQRLREQHLRDSFNVLLNEKVQQSEVMQAQLKDIDENLMKITSQYTELRKLADYDGTIPDNTAHHIGVQINAIADMLAKDKQKILTMQQKLRKQQTTGNEHMALLEKLSELNIALADKQNKIKTLTEDLQNKNIQLDNLSQQVKQLQNESKSGNVDVTKLEDERYSGYFLVGTKAELLQAKVITSKGGFIGIGQTTTLAGNGDISSMRKIDIRNVHEIPLTGQKAEILTPHPASSYSLQGNPDKPSSILITSTDDFWQASKCLVIMVK